MTIAPIVESPAVRDVLAERIAQVERFGHDPWAEAEQPPHRLAAMATEFGKIARDRTDPGKGHDLPAARKKAVQAAALWIATIDVLDAHIARDATARATHRAAQQSEPDLPGLGADDGA